MFFAHTVKVNGVQNNTGPPWQYIERKNVLCFIFVTGLVW